MNKPAKTDVVAVHFSCIVHMVTMLHVPEGEPVTNGMAEKAAAAKLLQIRPGYADPRSIVIEQKQVTYSV